MLLAALAALVALAALLRLSFSVSVLVSAVLARVRDAPRDPNGPLFSQGFSGIEPESREKTAGKLGETLPALSAEAAARSADARLQSRLRARCLDALAVPLAVVFALLGASSPSPLAVFAAIFALLFRSPCLRLSLRTRFPFHDSQVYFSR